MQTCILTSYTSLWQKCLVNELIERLNYKQSLSLAFFKTVCLELSTATCEKANPDKSKLYTNYRSYTNRNLCKGTLIRKAIVGTKTKSRIVARKNLSTMNCIWVFFANYIVAYIIDSWLITRWSCLSSTSFFFVSDLFLDLWRSWSF